MSAVVMTIAWQPYRAKYAANMPFHARAFGLCIKEAWHSIKGGKFMTYDNSRGTGFDMGRWS